MGAFSFQGRMHCIPEVSKDIIFILQIWEEPKRLECNFGLLKPQPNLLL